MTPLPRESDRDLSKVYMVERVGDAVRLTVALGASVWEMELGAAAAAYLAGQLAGAAGSDYVCIRASELDALRDAAS